MSEAKDALRDELITLMRGYVPPQSLEDCKFRITMALNSYTVEKEETALTIYEGDVNEQILMRFLMAKTARGCSKRTVQYYKDTVTAALNAIGKPYTQITSDDIRYYLAVRVARDGVTKTTANNERRNLSAFYGWLQKEEILLKNPMNKIEAIKETKKKKKAFEQIEIEKMRYACKSSLETALIEVLLSTWARVSELTHMRIDEINEGKIIVHGKGDKEREVYLNAKAQIALSTYLAEREDDNPLIFPKSIGGTKMTGKRTQQEMREWYKHKENIQDGFRDPSGIEENIRRIGKRAGVLNAHPHRFRRTGATMALRGGMPIMTVSKLLGHENIATTQIYLDISDKELEQAHEKYVV